MPRLASTAGAGLSLCQLQPKQSIPLPIESPHAAHAASALESGRVEPACSSAPQAEPACSSAPRQYGGRGAVLTQVTACTRRITPHGSRRPIECTTPHRKLRRHMAAHKSGRVEPAYTSALTGGAVLTPVTAHTKRTTPHRNLRGFMRGIKAGWPARARRVGEARHESGFNPQGLPLYTVMSAASAKRRKRSCHGGKNADIQGFIGK